MTTVNFPFNLINICCQFYRELQLFWSILIILYLVPLWKVRERLAESSRCLSASSSWESFCFCSAERACPALTKASGVCAERKKDSSNTMEQLELYMWGWGVAQSHLVSEHEWYYFQDMHTPLLLTLRWCQELHQVIKATYVKGPQQPVMDAGIIIHFLHERHITEEAVLRKVEKTTLIPNNKRTTPDCDKSSRFNWIKSQYDSMKDIAAGT